MHGAPRTFRVADPQLCPQQRPAPATRSLPPRAIGLSATAASSAAGSRSQRAADPGLPQGSVPAASLVPAARSHLPGGAIPSRHAQQERRRPGSPSPRPSHMGQGHSVAPGSPQAGAEPSPARLRWLTEPGGGPGGRAGADATARASRAGHAPAGPGGLAQPLQPHGAAVLLAPSPATASLAPSPAPDQRSPQGLRLCPGPREPPHPSAMAEQPLPAHGPPPRRGRGCWQARDPPGQRGRSAGCRLPAGNLPTRHRQAPPARRSLRKRSRQRRCYSFSAEGCGRSARW